MPDLELTVQRKTDNGYPVVASLIRPGEHLDQRREEILNLDLKKLDELQFEPFEYGVVLGKALFVDGIRDTFLAGLGGMEPLRVLLAVEDFALRSIHWHRLAAPFTDGWRFLAAQQNTPFSLDVPSPALTHFNSIGRRDLRALLLVAGPELLSGNYKLTPFDVAKTIETTRSALGNIPCDTLNEPSLDTLCAALTETPYTILHIVCHGAVNKSDDPARPGETILFFPKDKSRTPTPANDLLNRLGSLRKLPHFVFLSTCESALPQNGLGSLSQRMVRELGFPAVLAMTDRVSIDTAQAMAAPFYNQLYKHGYPDLALAEALAGLQGRPDLTVPALLSRLGGHPLFSDDLNSDVTDKGIALGLEQLAASLPERAPVLKDEFDRLATRLRSTLGVDSKALSDSRRSERSETLFALNTLSLESLELSFNALCLGQIPPVYDARSPFRGLESFRPEDAPYFFGREMLTKRLIQKLKEYNFLAVLGASGSGKSSLVMAGLIPALNLPYCIFRPGAEPLSALDKAVQAAPALLVVDQFEELFTLSSVEQRAEFISRLVEQTISIRVVITIRTDFLGEVASYESLKDEIQKHQEIIPPMTGVELRRAMEEQAAFTGLRFEADLSQQMLDDVAGEPGAMPLLQHALWELWKRRHGRKLLANEYRAFGGVKQAIASTADDAYEHCSDRERMREIFLRLTRLDEGTNGRDTRRLIPLRDLNPVDSDPAVTTMMVKQLSDARLLVVTDGNVEVAHEALIRYWERLHTWLNQDRESLRLREIVSEAAYQWGKNNRDKNLLNHRASQLALAKGLRSKYKLNESEEQYLDACIRAEKQRFWLGIAVSGAILVLIFLLAWNILSKERPFPGKWIRIPAGSFIMGMDEEEANLSASLCLTGALEKDKGLCPASADLLNWSGRQVNANLAEYQMMDNEVTRAQYQQCVKDGACRPPQDWNYNNTNLNHPVTNLDWFQAGEYCTWLGGRLPTEGEWEKAARGPDNFIFPWGNIWDGTKANLEHTDVENIQNIDKYGSTDINKFIIKNMAGNVLEWTASEGFPLALNQEFSNPVLVRDDFSTEWPVIIRGGFWGNQRSAGMASNRESDSILSRREGKLGFRCACPAGQTCKSPWNWIWIWSGN